MCKKTIAVILSVILAFSCIFMTGYAETTADDLLTSSNVNNYANTRWASIVKSHLYAQSNKLTRVEIADNAVYVEIFDSSYNLTSSAVIDGELNEIDGVYIGSKFNFIVCSQQNIGESDDVEVVRIIKYSKAWERMASASIFGANTTKFTNAGSLRFLEFDNHLYIYSSHEMYKTDDGNNHQANMLITVNTDNMTVTDDKCDVSNNHSGYTSHSFNQFIAADYDTNSIVTVDHGDAIPRTIVMFKYSNQLDSDTLKNPEMLNVFDIAGEKGDNTTGVSVGDFIVTDNNYMISFNSIEQGSTSTLRSPYLAIIPKASFTEDSVKIIKLDSESSACGYPYITDIGDGKYSIMWEKESEVLFTTVDENGTLLTDISSFKASLSDCEPILTSGKLLWYVTNSSAPVFYSINLNTDEGKIEKCFHSYTETVKKQLTCEADGLLQFDCNFCGDSYTQVIESQGHIDSDNDSKCDKCYNYMPTDISTIKLTWEKDYYCVADGSATLNISAPSGVYIADMTCDMPCGAKWNSTQLILNFLGTAGTYNLYFKFSDGQVVYTALTVNKEEQAETTTEITTEITTEATTETTTETTTSPTTETTTETTTQPTTQPTTDSTTENPTAGTTQPPTETTTEQEPETFMLGDMDKSGKITASDARTILRISARLETGTDEQLKIADVDGNGRVNASDARKALRISARLETL